MEIADQSSTNKNKPAVKSERHYLLDGMRGAAAFAVCLYHYLSWGELVQLESAGIFAVVCFFILSSLSMVIAYRPKFSHGLNEKTVKVFYRNRIARIMPLLLLVAGLRVTYAVISGENLVAEFMRFYLTGTGLFSLHLPGYISSFIGAWSLGLELMFYMIFPVVLLLVSTAQIKNLLIVLFMLIAGQQAVIILMQKERLATLGDIEYWFSFATFLVYAPFFMVGILIERVKFYRRTFYTFLGFTLFFFVMLFSIIWNGKILTNHSLFLALGVICSLAVLFVYNGTWSDRLVPILQFAGDVSYPLYLIHWMIWFGLGFLGTWLHISVETKIFIAVIIAISGAYFVFKFIEYPVRSLLRSG